MQEHEHLAFDFQPYLTPILKYYTKGQFESNLQTNSDQPFLKRTFIDCVQSLCDKVYYKECVD